jgi:hypothetical protein
MTPASSPKSSPVGIDIVPFSGWQNNLRISNGTVELIVTLEVGPRILSYKKCGGFNPLKIFEDQVGTAGEQAWKNRGGHRLWIAPEDKVTTYFPDNAPVTWDKLGDLWVKLVSVPETTSGYQKEIEISLDAAGTDVTVLHRITRIDSTPAYLSPWALTVMAAGGIAVMPQPELGQHPRDLLPNRNLVLWPYTDMSDPRWRFGRKYILLKQDASGGPTKIGLSHQVGWSGYLVGGVFFLKRYPWNPEAIYPDNGCNFETFTNARMLELESLGPLRSLEHKQSLEHVERWELHDGPASLDAADPEGQLDKFLEPILKNHVPGLAR